MIQPRVSIIIPTYNREDLIILAIESILKQTYQDFEILVIDDASTDKTAEVIREINQSKVRYFQLSTNSGQCVARNYGLSRAKGEFVAFLDSDDTWLPEKLEKQIALFDKGSERLGAVYCYSYQKYVKSNTTLLNEIGYFRGDIHDKFLLGFCPPTPSLFLIKKSALDRVNGFDEGLVTFVDLDLWMRISESYDFDYVEEPLIIKYEQIGDQYVNNFEKRYKGYSLFFDKWGNKVEERFGSKELLKLKRHITYAIVGPLLHQPPGNLRKNIPKLVGLLLQVRSTKCVFYLKAVLIFIFGDSILDRIRKVYKKK